MERTEVYELIDGEREYQNMKWAGHKHEVGAYLTLLDDYLRRAKEEWAGNSGDTQALRNIRKVAAIAVHCMEEHGAPSRRVELEFQGGGL